MWFVPEFPRLFSRADYYQRSKSVWEHTGSWGPSLPVAMVMGLFCAYVWARLKPWLSSNQVDRKEYILQDLSNAKTFLTSLHDSLWNSRSPPQNTETISKAGEDVLLQRTASRKKDGTRKTSESITGTLTIGTSVEKSEVSRLRRKLRRVAQKEHVHEILEGSVLLQTRLPITSSLLSEAFDLARQAIALDPQSTLQLGGWGVIMQSGDSIWKRPSSWY